jgi:DNA repair exonuclease SbcCD ATPase subunit
MIINIPFKKLRKIAHCADIHIRLLKRHDEYRRALRTFYTQLRQTDLTDGVIVVAGDVLHAKTDMSPEMVSLTTEFLSSLADIAPTFVIAGNHDLNLSNMNRLDSLTPIIKAINHTNLHYLKHSGVYQVADTDIAVMSILDEKTEWPTDAQCRADSRKIALYHGPVHGATTDANFTVTDKHVEASRFDGFDMVLLGDIHRYQVLQKRNAKDKKPVIVYSSSLIQQNHGEDIDNHGWCLWDVAKCSHEFVTLPNEYGYYTYEVEGENITFPTNMPQNVRLRLFTGNLDAITVKKIVAMFRNKYNIIELSVNKAYRGATKNKTSTGLSTKKVILSDISNVSVQNNLIQDWVERAYETISPDLMRSILDINTKLNTEISHDDASRNIHWNPITLKFSNMFSYGSDNEIIFGNMQGIYGIFAPNATGKSSAIDALIFCLYDKTPRAFRGDHIMNNRRDTFACELKFEINQQVYGIRRTGTRKKTGEVKVDVLFWKENEDGTQTSLNGEDRRDTNANIRNYVGSYEDFVLTALSSQNGSALFIDKSHSERKDLLIQFMGLSVFDKLCDAANEKSKEISAILKKFKKIDFTETLAETQTKLKELKADRKVVETSLHDKKVEQETFEIQLKDLQSNKKPVPDIELDIDILQSNLTKVQSQLSDAREATISFEDRLSVMREQIKKKTQLVIDANLPELRKSVEEHTKLATVLSKEQSALKLTVSKISEKEKFKTKLESYKYNPTCDVCVENNKSVIGDMEQVTHELIDLYSTQSSQEESIKQIKTKMEPLVEKVNLCTNYENLQAEVHQLQKKASGMELEIQKLITTIEKQDRINEQIERDIVLHRTNEDNIKHNLANDKDIGRLEKIMQANRKEINELERHFREVHGETKVLDAAKKDIISKIEEATELENRYDAYKWYMNAVGRDGIPYELMTRAIPAIEAEINNILSQIVEFAISLRVEGKNIIGRLHYDNDRIWPLENSSGMERFISSLAIRVALLNASNLPKSNFLLIDEGLGALDAENLSSMSTLLNTLKNQFDFMIIISHLEAVRDMVDKVIEIKREDGYSYINV